MDNEKNTDKQGNNLVHDKCNTNMEVATEFNIDYLSGLSTLKERYDKAYTRFIKRRAEMEQYIAGVSALLQKAPKEVLDQLDVPEGLTISPTELFPELYTDTPDRAKHAADEYKFNKFVKQWNEVCYKHYKEMETCLSTLEEPFL